MAENKVYECNPENETAKQIYKPYEFDVESWLENLLLDECRQTYKDMSDEEKSIVRKAYIRGCLITEARLKGKQ